MSILSVKKSRGRPRLDTEAVNVRMGRPMLDALDAFIAEQPDPKPTRPEAVRTLLFDALAGVGHMPKGR